MRMLTAVAFLALLAGCEDRTPPPKATPAYPGPPQVHVAGAAFSRDGKLLLTAYRIEQPEPKAAMPKRLALWEVATGKKLWAAHPATEARVGPAADNLFPVAFLPGDKLVLLRDKTSLQLWDVAKGSCARTFAKDGDWALSCRPFGLDRRGVREMKREVMIEARRQPPEI
jgi:hypothetical protein